MPFENNASELFGCTNLGTFQRLCAHTSGRNLVGEMAWAREMAVEGKTKAAAYPTKEFFVRMITRDISLEDCILDLIDNSVDGAWHQEGSRPMGLADGADLSIYKIEIEASVNGFVIRDNCGGMTLDNAADHAFSFGRSSTAEHEEYSIGVYGIGMKRAVFKLGGDIKVRSTFEEENGSRLAFAVPINVATWLNSNEPPWDFDIVDDEQLTENGVEIRVGALTPGTVTSFGSPAFLQNLSRTIARDYSLHIARGLAISLNGAPVRGWSIELRQSEEYVPMRVAYDDDVDGDPVSVEIIGGMAAPPPESVEPDESDEGDRRYGWYVVCNGRIVLAADKSAIIPASGERDSWGFSGSLKSESSWQRRLPWRRPPPFATISTA